MSILKLALLGPPESSTDVLRAQSARTAGLPGG